MGYIGTGVSSQVVVCFGLLHNVKEDKAKWHKAQSDIQGVFKKRPNFCYKDFTAHFTAF
jgi:hypothetical protein